MQTIPPRRLFLHAGTVFLAALAAYLLLPTRMYYWDGVLFSMDIEKAHGPFDPLFHRHHLIYRMAGNWIYRLLEWAGHPVRALYVLQRMDAVLAAVCVALVFFLLRRMPLSTTASAALAFLFAFSATWWRFATNADAYIPSVFFILLSYAVLRAPRRQSWMFLILAALLHAIAMLFHQLAFWFFPVAIAILWTGSKQSRARKQAVSAAIAGYCTLAGTPVAVLYLYAYRTLRPAGSFPGWVSGHSPDSHFTFGFIRDFLYTLRGNLRLFFGGKLDALQPDWLQIAGLIGLVVVLTLLAVRHGAMMDWMRALAAGLGPRFRAEAPLVVWLAFYLVFLYFWQPEHEFYRLFYWPTIVLLLGALIAGREPRPATLLPLSVAAVALWNLVFLIAPQSSPEANQPLRFALEAHDRWPAGTLIVFRDFVPDLWTIAYFNMQASWRPSACTDPLEMEAALRRAESEGHEMWLDGACYDLLKSAGPGAAWLAERKVVKLSRSDRRGKLAGRFYEIRQASP